MELTRENVAALIGAVVAVLLQIMVAPAIALFSAIPNFIVAFCVVRTLCERWPPLIRRGRSSRSRSASSSTWWAVARWAVWPLCSCW